MIHTNGDLNSTVSDYKGWFDMVFIFLTIACALWFFIIGSIAKQSILMRIYMTLIGAFEFWIVLVVVDQIMIKQDFFLRAIYYSGPDIGPIITYEVVPTGIIVFLSSLLFISALNMKCQCPSCGNLKIRMRIPIVATIVLALSVFLFITANAEIQWVSILFFIPGMLLWLGNKRVFCNECGHNFFIKTKNDELYICCPKCKRNLEGVTENMIGDIGVCPKCKTEFEIEHPSPRNSEPPIKRVVANTCRDCGRKIHDSERAIVIDDELICSECELKLPSEDR